MLADDLEIAPATDDEREWAAALMARSEPWVTLGRTLASSRTVFADPDNLVFIARTGSPCGFVILQRHGIAGAPYLRSLAVSETMRGAGIGTRLIRFAEDYFHDARFLFLCVSSFNPRAQALYARLGYTVIGELEDFVVAGASEWLMSKRLRP